MIRAIASLLAAFLVTAPQGAWAMGCFPLAGLEPRVQQASFSMAAIPAGASLQLNFLGHATFLVETAAGVTIVTDYNDYVRAPLPPRVVTMNNAHDTHFSYAPPAGTQHVLRGWNPAGGWAEHDLIVEDVRIRNVPTAVHGRDGDQALSNSIFVFEFADLCVAHLGHLHHMLTSEQVAELGQIDVVLVPVDGSYTMSQDEMMQVIQQIRARLVIPMHYFGQRTLDRFLANAQQHGMRVRRSASSSIALSQGSLPDEREVLVLPGH